ncbi:GNAT family N-acetyltransferase [Streptomyces canus]|uniref:GNAT family N-acetyltransferase n=1 Tax=Streptomyces canus TaxID=58343 RepID=UPI00224D7309|nr:GNAT family N-acetyltransferase [Streptomyces canus]MCX4854934.1 GNAT family N-acetyltransferase [Streptomyces canus]WSW39667.1 GNAT family N-acetyltransferase [Streptomyces canus]
MDVIEPGMPLNGLGTSAPDTPTEIVLLDPGERVIGRLRFRTCQICRTGQIAHIWVCDVWQRQGLGRELLHSLLACRPGYRWTTTTQTSNGRAFFFAMAEETTMAWPQGAPLCRHLLGPLRQIWKDLSAHWSP